MTQTLSAEKGGVMGLQNTYIARREAKALAKLLIQSITLVVVSLESVSR